MRYIEERSFVRAIDSLIDTVDTVLRRNPEKKFKPWPLGLRRAEPKEREPVQVCGSSEEF